MGFTIRCNTCGNENLLESENLKDQANIDIEIKHGFVGVSEVIITCKKCNERVYDDNE